MAESFAMRLGRSLDALHEARPGISARLAAALGPCHLELDVDGERLGLGTRGGRATVFTIERAPEVHVTTRRDAILALVEGRHDLLEALRCGSVRVRGAWQDLVRLDAALAAYLDGAVRVPAMHEHWSAYAEGSGDG